MNILLVVNSKWWNAEAHYAFNLALSIQEHAAHHVFVMLQKETPAIQYFKDAFIPFFEIDLIPQNQNKILEFIQVNQVQVINCYQRKGLSIFIKIKTELKKKDINIILVRTLGNARENIFGFLIFDLYFYWKKKIDGYIAVNNQKFKYFRCLKKQKTIYYSSNGLIQEEDHGNQVAQKYKIDPSAFNICILGRIHQGVKGHEYLIQAMVELKKRQANGFILPQVYFLVKKQDEHREEQKKLQEQIQKNNLTGNIHFIYNKHEELSQILSHIKLGVIPSIKSEVNCRVAIEFYSLNIPIVAFKVGTLPEVIIDGKTGYLCEKKNEKALASIIEELIKNEDKIRYLRQNVYVHYFENYHSLQLYRQTYMFYMQLKHLM